MPAADSAAGDGHGRCRGEAPSSQLLAEMKANSTEWRTSQSAPYTHAQQRRQASRHHSLATGFFPRKARAFEQLNTKSQSSELDCKRGSCKTSSGNENVDH